jgi:hypothetical protein
VNKITPMDHTSTLMSYDPISRLKTSGAAYI